MDYLFCGCKDLENIFNIKILNTKLVTNMNNMFNGFENLKNLDGINELKQIMLSIIKILILNFDQQFFLKFYLKINLLITFKKKYCLMFIVRKVS